MQNLSAHILVAVGVEDSDELVERRLAALAEPVNRVLAHVRALAVVARDLDERPCARGLCISEKAWSICRFTSSDFSCA